MDRSEIHRIERLPKPRIGNCIRVLIALLLGTAVQAQQLAFPGAEGYGRFTTGGRGGEVIEVTNLNDSGLGSLRAAIETSGPRTVVFRVSGTIHLESELRIDHGDITIAGQTAPGDGICVAEQPLKVDGSDVIIRYMRFRLGDVDSVQADAIEGQGERNIIIDHCSASWSVDECVSFYRNIDFTLQWCLISESLQLSVHVKDEHGYGGIWGGKDGASFHHNLLAHHDSRNPRFNTGNRNPGEDDDRNVDHRNNVIYNWESNSAYGGEGGWYNMVNNYYKYGPATKTPDRIVEPYDEVSKWYIDGNYVYGDSVITADNWAGGVQHVNVDRVRVYTPFPYAPVITHTAENAFKVVLAEAGASLKRDPLDQRIVHEARTGTATYGVNGIIDSQNEVGGWPELLTYDVPVDNDHDGMADDWELDNGLNPTDPLDRNGDFNGDGYTNLEKYLNSLCVRPDYVRPPAELEAKTLSYDSIQLDWKENASDEYGFFIERSIWDTTNYTIVGIVLVNDTSYTDTDLDEQTTYYYRVGTFKAGVVSSYSNEVKAMTLSSSGTPLQASNPGPPHHAANVPISTELTWDAAAAATSYDMYLGTDTLIFVGNQVVTEFEPRNLQDSTTYYWRIDPVNANGTTEGEVWQFTTEPFAKAVIAYWPMNLGYGLVAFDASGNDLYAYLTNMSSTMSWVDGRLGDGLQFDGIDDYLWVLNEDVISISVRGFSIAFWVKANESAPASPWLSKAGFAVDSLKLGYEVKLGTGGEASFAVGDGDKVSLVQAPGSHFLTGDWVMLTAVRDRIDHTLQLYADTTLVAIADDSTWKIASTGDLFIATNARMDYFFQGEMDEIRIFNYSLDSTEIRALYKEGLLSTEPEAIAVVPQELVLYSYPNPFNSSALVTYSVTQAGPVQLTLYNLLGQEVDSLVNQHLPAGFYTFRLDASNLASGIYYVRLSNQDQVKIRRISLIK